MLLTDKRKHNAIDQNRTHNGLDPMNGSGSDPDEIARFLNIMVDWDVVSGEFFEIRPPGATQVIDAASDIKQILH